MISFTCDRQILNEALSAASRVASGRAAHDGTPKSLHLTAAGDSLTITGSDSNYSLVTSLTADIPSGQEGACLIDARILSDMVRRFSGEDVSVKIDDQYQAVIASGQSEFSIMALSAERYTAVPEVDSTRTVSLSQPVLKRLISLVSYAVSINETRGVHTGILFDGKADLLTLVALDGHRMAVADTAMENEESFRFVAHASPVSEIERLLGGDEEQTVTIEIGRRYAKFDLGQTQIVARLLDGEFLQYENSMPKTHSVSAGIDARSMVQSIERVSLLISDKLKNPIRLKFSKGRLDMSCATGLGRAFDALDVESEGEIEIGFNHRYLLDALRHATDDTLELQMNGPLQPMLIVPRETAKEDGQAAPKDGSYRFLILPVRLNVE